MYHIKNDKRMHTSAKLISEALAKCLETKELSQITITELLKKSALSRATFYRLFDSIPDVLHYEYDMAFEEILAEIKVQADSTTSLSDVIIYFVAFWNDNHKLVEKIINSNQLNILLTSNQKYIKELLNTIYRTSSFNDIQYDYIACSLSAILVTWIHKGCSETPTDLVNTINQVVIDIGNLLKNDVLR